MEVITNVRSDYVYATNYKYFKISNDHIKYGGVHQKKKELFLTYDGVLKVLFCSQGDRGVRFRKWATRILFTMQMGSQDDKDKIAAEALNTDVIYCKTI